MQEQLEFWLGAVPVNPRKSLDLRLPSVISSHEAPASIEKLQGLMNKKGLTKGKSQVTLSLLLHQRPSSRLEAQLLGHWLDNELKIILNNMPCG